MRPGNRFRSRLAGSLAIFLLFFVFAVAPLVAEAPATKDDTSVVAAYAVKAGSLIPGSPAPAGADDDATYRQIWAAVKTIVPQTLLGRITRFEIFSTDASSDSASETDGYASLGDDGKTFVLGLNLDSATTAFVDNDREARKEYIQTLVHEFGHVLSLDPSQMSPDGSGGGLEIDEGTLLPDSYLNRFYVKFWKETWPNHGPETSSDEEGTALYNKAPSSFVSEYAATGPLEDFAETFSSFILDTKPKGRDIKDQKVLFFYDYPELVAMRDAFAKGISALR